ncbi:uncharacterized protein DUF4450 [Pseudoduganella lurida]|uniref:Uncharacterized protein DUF4450 n=1 Tax=Pseudoduganella lurida TaxID=1036180 RepID=A0A562R0N5_9BURK|nr:DUF4450 domain-containing protein [Pseudoduganella lurida]TWI62638.1 uncharacterized protein DUF4450 [Pseudoduganella lurida]
MTHAFARLAILPAAALLLIAASPVHAADPKLGVVPTPNLTAGIDRPLRYRPEGADFVIDNGTEFFNRPLYGGNSAFRVDGGDRPQFSLYLPGRGGNLRLGVRTSTGTLWLDAAGSITARYRPGELLYEIGDPALGPRGRLHLAAIAYAATEGLGLQVRGEHLAKGAELVFAFGAGNGQRGQRGGDIGTEKVPIGEYFQFAPEYARDTRIELVKDGFIATGMVATIGATASAPVRMVRADARQWNDLAALLQAGEGGDSNVALGRIALSSEPVYLSLQVTEAAKAGVQADYREAGAANASENGAAQGRLARFAPAVLAQRFLDARRHFDALRNRVRIDTPDPYLNAAMGALNVAADAVWDGDQAAIMHGAIAWRTKLLGWRGPYALDALGWHERARQNFAAWTGRQNTDAIPDRAPRADPTANLARNEPGLHSNGDLSKSHYDMNLVFVDALLRHLLWTGDAAFAKAAWPVLERHLAWERRLFRREFGPAKLPLYDAYAAIWASDELYYNGGGVTHTSAYNAWHNEMAARIAPLAGKDPAPYLAEAAAIRRGMREQLWMPDRGAFGEYRDLLGAQQLHPSYGLWTFYHTLDSHVPTPFEAARMAADLDRQAHPIPVRGPGVPADRPYRMLPSSDWMPYMWSINNVVMGENLHTALAYWQAGRPDTAFELSKGALLASMYMGISPGNVGTLNYLDVYRRESQRDFADGSGVTSRTLVEGLFGVRPDALAGVLTLRPGFPRDWHHASLRHPDLAMRWRREGMVDHWTVTQNGSRFRQLALEVPAWRTHVARVTVNGKPAAWQADDNAVGAPRLRIAVPLAQEASVAITWRGAAPAADTPPIASREGFRQQRQGDFTWWTALPALAPEGEAGAAACASASADWTKGAAIRSRPVDLGPLFNDRLTAIFAKGKYQSPRAPHVTLALPAQGIGAWAGHLNASANIDDAGLRALGGTLRLPNGLTFSTPSGSVPNVAFTSRWDNYPRDVTVPLTGKAARAFLLLAGSTNHMQSRIDNGELVATYADGTQARLALRNPDNWWPIEQDYFIDDYQFPSCAAVPLRVDLKSGLARMPEAKGSRGTIDGGAATVLAMPLDPSRTLQSLTLRTLANDVVMGLMGVTLDATP